MGYKATNPEIFRKNLDAARTRRTGGSDFWRPTVGKAGSPVRNVIRPMPMHENMTDVIVEGRLHYQLGPKGDQTARCLAPSGQPCPACEKADALFKQAKAEKDPEKSAALKEQAGDIKAKPTFYMNVVDLQAPEKGVQIYSMGPDEEKEVRLCFQDDDQEFQDIADPKTGRDILIFAEFHPTKQFKNKPVRELKIKAKDKPTPLMDMGWLDDINDLSEFDPIQHPPSPQDVENALAGKEGRSYKTSSTAATDQVKPVATATPATAQKLTNPAQTATKPKPAVQRKPVAEASSDPYAPGRAAILAAGFKSPVDVTPDEVPDLAKSVPCFAPTLLADGAKAVTDPKNIGDGTTVTDPTDKGCQGCRLLLPCMTAVAEAAK